MTPGQSPGPAGPAPAASERTWARSRTDNRPATVPGARRVGPPHRSSTAPPLAGTASHSSDRNAWRLTEFGEALHAHAVRLLVLEDEIGALVRNSTALRRGPLRIGSTHTPATCVFPRVIARYRATYLEIELSLDVAPSHVLPPKLLAYELEFCCINRYPSAKPGVAARAVVHYELVLIAHPESPAARAPDLTPRDVGRFRIIMHETGSISRQVNDAWCQEHAIQPNVLMDVSGTETMKQMVRENLGAAMVSALSCRDEVASGSLAARSLPGLTTRRTIYLVHRRDVPLTRPAEAFVQILLLRPWTIPES